MNRVKTTLRFLVILMLICASMTACGQSKAAKAVDNAIADLGTITVYDDFKIELLERAVAKLDEQDYNQLKNLEILEQARADYNRLRVDEVNNAINGIGKVTTASLSKIKAAESAYQRLNDYQKALITNYSVISEAMETYEDLLVSDVMNIITNLGEITLDSGDAIDNAEGAYKTLDAELQPRVSNLSELADAKLCYSNLKIENVITLINDIGTVTLDSQPVLSRAQDAYKRLTAEECERVGNYHLLTDGQEQLEGLQEEQKRIAEEAKRQEEIAAARAIIRVSKIWCSKPDSAGGVKIYFNFTNTSDKTIKYVNFGGTFYNAVDDIVKCQYENVNINYCSVTGPYEPGKGRSGTEWYWGQFYNWNIKTVKLSYLNIEYMDGTSVTLNKDQLNYVQY